MELRKAETMTLDLLKFHGLDDWHFVWMRARGTLGRCNYWRKTIYLSGPVTFTNTEVQVLNTILHEIAHALTGPNHGHDFVWKAKAIEIGCDGQRTGHIESQQLAKWKYTAPCGNAIYVNRRLKNLEYRFCRCCHGKLTLSLNKDLTR